MSNELTEKVLKELDEKLKNIDAPTVATYLMISTYITKNEPELDIKYRIFLLKKQNTLDYLFNAFNEIREENTRYEHVEKCLDIDESNFREFQGIGRYK